VFDDAGRELPDGTFEYARRYGEQVAALANSAIESSQPIEFTPFHVSAQPIAVPVHNALYRTARALGVIKREGLVWTGDFQSLGEPMTHETSDQTSAVESEVACL